MCPSGAFLGPSRVSGAPAGAGPALRCLAQQPLWERGSGASEGGRGLQSPCRGDGQAQELRVLPVSAPKPQSRTCCPFKGSDVDPGFRSPVQGDLSWSELPWSLYPLGGGCPGAVASGDVSAPPTSCIQMKSHAREQFFLFFLYCEIGQMLAEAAQRGWGASVRGGIQWATVLGGPLRPWRSLRTSALL